MEKNRFLRDPKIYIALLATLVITVLLFPEEGKFKYSYQAGRPWVYETLLSPIDFPILKTEQELLAEKEDKASQVIPYFEYDNAVANVQIQRLRNRQGEENVNDHVLYFIIESLYKMYSVGIRTLSSWTSLWRRTARPFPLCSGSITPRAARGRGLYS